MPTKVLSADQAMYTSWPWRVSNNVWNANGLVNGKDYTQSIKFDTAKVPNDLDINWKWPAGSDVRSFPYIGWNGVNEVQVQNLLSLPASFNYTKSGAGVANMAFEMWLTDQPGDPWTSGYEVMITLNPWGASGQPMYTLKSPTLNAPVYVHEDWGSGWTFAQAISPTTVKAGKIDIADMLKSLVWNQVLTGKEYLSEIQFGAEVVNGTGKVHVNNLGYAPAVAPTLYGTPGDDLFGMPATGGRHVDGGLGSDTAVYGDQRSNYEVKFNGDRVMVLRNGNIATLDTLDAVEQLRFADGVFIVATRSFTSEFDLI